MEKKKVSNWPVSSLLLHVLTFPTLLGKWTPKTRPHFFTTLTGRWVISAMPTSHLSMVGSCRRISGISPIKIYSEVTPTSVTVNQRRRRQTDRVDSTVIWRVAWIPSALMILVDRTWKIVWPNQMGTRDFVYPSSLFVVWSTNVIRNIWTCLCAFLYNGCLPNKLLIRF